MVPSEIADISRTNFQYFFQWNHRYFNKTFIEFCPGGSNLRRVSIGFDNSMAPFKQNAITWNNNDKAPWRIYASPGLNDLSCITEQVRWCNSYDTKIVQLQNGMKNIYSFIEILDEDWIDTNIQAFN